ncbi:LytR family transcriptional regulator [Nocardioides dongxiaopingii]|uniref:LCP family protein n=1 Tax=Nocardioides sp. S-1144 TaxID=2582905 RepID=UPI00110DDEE1|nr:LCP family protein [Nocardioides sp. S-1144]QCW51382.1 LytR family transcriptional regulator [Nocardioides sp. S-1144]
MNEESSGAAQADVSQPGSRRLQKPRKPHRRAVWSTILATQLVVALVTAGSVFLVHQNLNDNIADGVDVEHQVDKVLPDGVEKGDPEPLNILVLGSDLRAGAGNDIDNENADGSQRADTTILLHVAQDRKSAYGVSLPRDAIIDRPDCRVGGEEVAGEDGVRFNTAFAVGGATCAVQTVEALTKIHIDHFISLDFNGFKEMVDAVGGVEVCIPKDVDDDEHNIHFDAGTQVLDGQQSLNYVRERSVLSVNADIGRMKRQQAFIASMISTVSSAGTLTQPQKVIDFLGAFTSSIEVDSGLDKVGKLVDLAMEVQGTDLDKIKFITVPIEPDPDNPTVTLVWGPGADDLWERIRQDQKLGKDFSAGSIGADDDPSGGDGGNGDGGSGGSGGTSGSGSGSTGGSDEESDESAERVAAGLCA